MNLCLRVLCMSANYTSACQHVGLKPALIQAVSVCVPIQYLCVTVFVHAGMISVHWCAQAVAGCTCECLIPICQQGTAGVGPKVHRGQLIPCDGASLQGRQSC